MKKKILSASVIALIFSYNSYAVSCPTTKVSCPTTTLNPLFPYYRIEYNTIGGPHLKCQLMTNNAPEIYGTYKKIPINCPRGCQAKVHGFNWLNRCAPDDPTKECYATCEPG
ncbi:MAG: hypothetical protein ACD_16C00084G0010 [uncultured bacterium]|nr:MAG: hypothetical protein ACD_16C00084G0010 [uncultured bacterium]